MTGKPARYSCSFCGKGREAVRRLIAGPGDVFICNECVTLCNEILVGDPPSPTGAPSTRPRAVWQRQASGPRWWRRWFPRQQTAEV